MLKAALNPRIQASYLTILFVHSNLSLVRTGYCAPVSDTSTAPTPAPLALEAPKKYIKKPGYHLQSSSFMANSIPSSGTLYLLVNTHPEIDQLAYLL